MILYYSPGACSLAPHILLEETGVRHELVEVNVQQGKTQEPEFLKLNPKARVPVLVTGTEVLTEVPAICWYIGSTAGRFIPADVLLQARMLEWFNWLSGTLHAVAFGGKWRPQRFVTQADMFRDVQAMADRNLRDGFAHVEQWLADKPWAIGAEYTLVDPYVFVFHNWARSIGVDVRSDYPRWHAHSARMLARPAVQRALQREGF
ncbi:glutathione S-transferase family protein [Noviherbaspirillum massiliense]|uniref:glutathione S-transferase family protein n=1 Tax=Noviherbaspirillum massiliense TaxID=1465823 RepID=UPI0002F52971|nr:glutathione S-transferase N-terminal domain-containing protein [Noviherbaspirillum massiliense]